MSRWAALLAVLALLAVCAAFASAQEGGPLPEVDAASKTLTLSDPGTQYAKAGTQLRFTPSCTSDPSGASVTYKITNKSDSRLNAAVGSGGSYIAVRWTGGAIDGTGVATVTFTLTASASGYTSSSVTVTVQVKNVLEFTNDSSSGALGS